MNEIISTTLRVCYVKLASVAQKESSGWITAEQARELANDIFRDTASKIHRRRVSDFVTDN